ncbi:MAG: TIGR02281 family clan AA aspartic protease [Methylophilus sp.]|nr:TIGR02281 family clan AA aspartic protease [Methylophilus sp.]
MNNNRVIKVASFLALWCASIVYADTQVNVVGLFNGKALVTINGSAPQTLSVGQTKQGVKLVAADSQQATLLIEGKTKVLGMGQGVSAGGGAESTQNQPVNLYADSSGHFFGSMSVNGASLKYVVDTGATAVALNSADAKRANISYLTGEKSVASTASGQVVAYRVTLNTVKIGTIVLNNVSAVVIEGGFPEVVLLGMTALNRLDMKRDNSTMTLTKKY